MTSPIQRVCFLMHLRRDRIDDYLDAHSRVWPEMLAALTECGWTNYSLFLKKDEGLVVAYLETADFASATTGLARRSVNATWQATMAPYFETPSSDAGFDLLEEYFHLA